MASQNTTDTSLSLTGLVDETTYTVTVVAKGDGVNTLDSEAATTTFTTTAVPALDAPTGLALDASADPPTDSSFSVSWDPVADATGYTATASADGEGDIPGAIDDSGTPIKASFSSLSADTEYTVSVVALGDGEDHLDSPAATLTVSTTAHVETLDAPTGLTSSNVTYDSADVSWDAVDGAESYDVSYEPDQS
jgi:hypothetical protein